MGTNGIEFANSLRPLEPLKQHVSVFKGLWNPTKVEGAGGQTYDLSTDPNRKLCRLHLALMDRMGVQVGKFGDAENALAI